MTERTVEEKITEFKSEDGLEALQKLLESIDDDDLTRPIDEAFEAKELIERIDERTARVKRSA
jgi:hypothetical protein